MELRAMDTVAYDRDKVRNAMRLHGFDQFELATRAHVSEATVSRFLSGREIRPGNLRKIASALGVDVRQLVDDGQ